MLTGINESKTLTKHTSCKFKCKLMKENVIQINGGTTINVDVMSYMSKRLYLES